MKLRTRSSGDFSWYVSPCCGEIIDVDLDTRIGSCRACGTAVCRANVDALRLEWIDPEAQQEYEARRKEYEERRRVR